MALLEVDNVGCRFGGLVTLDNLPADQPSAAQGGGDGTAP